MHGRRRNGCGAFRRSAPCHAMRMAFWCERGETSSRRPTRISGRMFKTRRSAMPATTSRARIVTCRPASSSSGCRCSGCLAISLQYSARSGAEISIEDRLNSCMTRSMNGRPLPNNSPEMQAMVAYIKFLSTGVAAGQKLPGLGAGTMPELKRAADPKRGASVYARACAGCHNTDGSGERRSIPSSDLGYMVPPLWGPDSFNNGAGMARLITIANFVHANMPAGTDYWNPLLSVDDAWDVAAYVVSQPRPQFSPDWTRTSRIVCESRSMRLTVLTPMGSASGSTNTARSLRSARRSNGLCRSGRVVSRPTTDFNAPGEVPAAGR